MTTRSKPKARKAIGKAEAVALFTGFPGFIGQRLLPRLLALAPGMRVVCLVQERFLATARSSIETMGKEHPHTRDRIETVLGDITSPGLGLGGEDAKALRSRLTLAYHLAAVYDLAVARDLALRVNVEGTRNVLAFLGDCRHLRRLHYVSTAYVSGAHVGVFRESDLDVGQSFKNFYEETKFLAEVEVVRSGLPASVYRPGIVVGDSRTGETGKFDGPYFVLAAMERLPSPGVFPKVGSGAHPVNIVPVDFAVEALAQLSGVERSGIATFHLTDPDPLTAHEIAALLARGLGKRFLFAPLPAFVMKGAFAPAAVQRFFGMPVQTLDYFDHPCRYDATEATRELSQRGVACPRLPEYVDKLVAFYRERKGSVRREAMV